MTTTDVQVCALIWVSTCAHVAALIRVRTDVHVVHSDIWEGVGM